MERSILNNPVNCWNPKAQKTLWQSAAKPTERRKGLIRGKVQRLDFEHSQAIRSQTAPDTLYFEGDNIVHATGKPLDYVLSVYNEA